MRDIIEKHGAADRITVASSATSSEEIWGGVGNPVYPSVKKLLAERGIDCSDKRARLLTRRDYAGFDLIVVMDGANLRNTLRVFGGDPEGKVRKLLDFTGRGGDVADPWYTRDFTAAERDIDDGVRALIGYLKNV